MVARPCRSGRAQGRRGLWRRCGRHSAPAVDEKIREHATAAGEFDPAEILHGQRGDSEPSFILAILPLVVVMAMNFLMSLVVLPRLDFSFLAEESVGR